MLRGEDLQWPTETDSLQLSISISETEEGNQVKDLTGIFLHGEGQEREFDVIEQAAMAAIEVVEENTTESASILMMESHIEPSGGYHHSVGNSLFEGESSIIPLQAPLHEVSASISSLAEANNHHHPAKSKNLGNSASLNPKYEGRICVDCHSTESSSWLKDKTKEGCYNCLKCYQKKSRTGPVKDMLSDGTMIQRTCTRCSAQDTSRWHRDIVHDSEVNGVVRPAFICGKCKYKVRKSREAPLPIDGRTRRVDRKGGMLPYHIPSPNRGAGAKKRSSKSSVSSPAVDFNLDILPLPLYDGDYMDVPVSAEALNH